MFISLYEPFSEQDYANDDNHATVINCLVHLLSIDKIDVRGFEMWFKDGHVGGDIAWGISDWDEYMAEDHNIHEKFDGYLFYIDADEHGDLSRGEDQKILTKEEIKPFIKSIIEHYLKIDIQNNTGVWNLIWLSKDFGFY